MKKERTCRLTHTRVNTEYNLMYNWIFALIYLRGCFKKRRVQQQQ